MTAKEYLQQYRNLDVRINAKLEQVARLRELATKVSPSQSDGGHGGGVSDRVGNIVSKIVDYENDINAEIDRLMDLKCEIEKLIDSVTETALHDILELRYINLKKWEEIAVTLRIDLRWVYRLHGRALKKLTIESDYKSVI